MCGWVGRGWGWGVEGVAWPLRGAAFAIAVGADPAPLVCRAARPQPRALAGAARAAAPLAQLCVCRGPHARPVAPPVIPGAPLLLARRRAACCTALHSQGPCGPRLPTACAPPAAAALQGTRRVLVRAALPREFRDASLWGSNPVARRSRGCYVLVDGLSPNCTSGVCGWCGGCEWRWPGERPCGPCPCPAFPCPCSSPHQTLHPATEDVVRCFQGYDLQPRAVTFLKDQHEVRAVCAVLCMCAVAPHAWA